MRLKLRLDRLAALLAASRVSQNHWALRLGLSRGHWSDLVNGRHPFPSARTRERMVEVFGAPLEELFEPVATATAEEVDFRVAIAPRYELTSELGQGGMGTVYLAHDRALGRLVALKMVAAEASAGVGATSLLQEIALASRLQSPHILPLFDAGERAGTAYYVMPYVRGGSLAARLQAHGRLQLAEALALVDGIAAGVAAAHDERVLHCDIKPENVLVDGRHAYVMDFGIARKLHSESREWASVRRDLDLSAGTPAYVSPEQATGTVELDPRSDVYSLACVTYQLLTGRLPFGGTTTRDIVSRRFTEPPPALRELAPEVPMTVAAAIEAGMALDREDRPTTVREFARALHEPARVAGWGTRIGHRLVSARALPRRAARAADTTRSRLPTRWRDWIATVRQDVRYSVRHRLGQVGLTLTSLAMLGLGIGLTVAVFAVMKGVLLDPLPFANSERLVVLQSVDSTGNAFSLTSAENWADWRSHNRTLAAVAIFSRGGRVGVRARGDAVRANVRSVSPEFFDVLRPRMRIGRPFTAADLSEGARPVVVSEGFWRRVLGEAATIDFPLQVNGFPYSVVGVLAAGQELPEGTEIWTPYVHRAQGGVARDFINWTAVGRMRDDATPRDVERDLSMIAERIRAAEPKTLYSYGVRVQGLREDVTGNSSDTLVLFLGAVGLVLLIACANLAGANLAHGATRSREMAIRSALGASRGRLVRQVLIEHGLLALSGGAVGVAAAWVLTRSAALLAASQLPRVGAVVIDGWVLAFAFVASSLAAVLTGILPAIQAGRAAPQQAMTAGSRHMASGGRGLPGRVLVGAEIAMALMLVTGAGLLIQSLRHVLARPLGFEPRHVATAEITLGGPRYARDSLAVFDYWRRLHASLREIPGVRGVALAEQVPLVFGGTGFVDVEGKDVPGATAGYRSVSEGYLDALGIRLLQGRDLSTADGRDTPRVAMVNRQMAERFWPGESPIGRRVRSPSMDPGGDWVTVVGVMGDVRHFGFESDAGPEMFVLYRQVPAWRQQGMSAIVRGGGDDEVLLREVRAAVRRVDPDVPPDVALLQTAADRITASRRFTVQALTAFGGLSLVLTAIGIYGVLSFAVARRRREMAVRSALGADRSRLLRLVLGSGGQVIAGGVAAGLVGALVLAQLVQAMLFDLEARDPLVFGLAMATIAVVGFVAAFLPARRASRIPPMEALRGE